MNTTDTVKGIKETIKAATNVVTGKGATVALETKGKFAPGEIIEVTLTVTSTGAAFESKGAYVDLAGEDDVEETVMEKAREIVARKGDPTYAIEVFGPFAVAAGEKKIITGKFTVPADLDLERKWTIRGRVQAFGNDPDSPFMPIG